MDINTIMIIVSALLAVSEGLSLIPRVRSNGVFQMVVNVLRWIGAKPKTNKED
jgi:hypothetical protein